MQYIEAPNAFDGLKKSLFIAGSITGCPDWQKDMVQLIANIGINITVLNPRRAKFPMDDPNAAFQQIKWEFDMLRKADMISFWFSKDSMGPIVLYELGAHLMTNKPIVIGIEKGYPRQQDVEIQTGLIRPSLKIVYSLPDLVEGVALQFGWNSIKKL
jgi:hypothetical protein